MTAQSNFRVKHELVRRRGKILMRRFKDIPYECFRIRLFVTGNTDALESVEYELHSSFPDPIQHVRSRRGGFPLEIWTWGEFDVAVTFYPKVGAATETVYLLSYSDELPADDSEYLDVSPASLRKGK